MLVNMDKRYIGYVNVRMLDSINVQRIRYGILYNHTEFEIICQDMHYKRIAFQGVTLLLVRLD